MIQNAAELLGYLKKQNPGPKTAQLVVISGSYFVLFYHSKHSMRHSPIQVLLYMSKCFHICTVMNASGDTLGSASCQRLNSQPSD